MTEARKRAPQIADERSKENVAPRAKLERWRKENRDLTGGTAMRLGDRAWTQSDPRVSPLGVLRWSSPSPR